jgi:hypothetical protein
LRLGGDAGKRGEEKKPYDVLLRPHVDAPAGDGKYIVFTYSTHMGVAFSAI